MGPETQSFLGLVVGVGAEIRLVQDVRGGCGVGRGWSDDGRGPVGPDPRGEGPGAGVQRTGRKGMFPTRFVSLKLYLL